MWYLDTPSQYRASMLTGGEFGGGGRSWEYILVKVHDESSGGCLGSQQGEKGQVG